MAEKIVVIPTYKEKENVSAILHSIFDLQQDFHVIVIDDGSPDWNSPNCERSATKIPGTIIY
jgi:dolichol-phosphate mannosyltransferase